MLGGVPPCLPYTRGVWPASGRGSEKVGVWPRALISYRHLISETNPSPYALYHPTIAMHLWPPLTLSSACLLQVLV